METFRSDLERMGWRPVTSWQRTRINVEVYWSVVVWRLCSARFFLSWAWRALRGKGVIIDSREVRSNGGFKYLQCELSYTPVDKDHSYGKEANEG